MTTDKPESIDAYIAAFPTAIQQILEQVRATIKTAAPAAQETIKYAMPTFTLNGGNLVHFAAFKNHIGFYPTPSGTTTFQKELARYKSGKGSVQFPIDAPMPLDLIRRIVEFRVNEVREKAPRSKKA